MSDAIGTGVVKKLPVENMLLNSAFTKLEYDLLQVNLRLNSQQMREIGYEPKYDSGFVENAKTLVREFKDARGLHPLKVAIHGPPAVGKSHFARFLSNHYNVPIIDSASVVAEYVDSLVCSMLSSRALLIILGSQDCNCC